MELEGTYFLFGDDDPATDKAREALEDLGFKQATNIGYAVPIEEIAEAVTIAYFSIQSVSGGDIIGAGLQVFNLLIQWSQTTGRPKNVRHCDLVFEDTKTGKKASISNFEYRSIEEVKAALEALKQ